MECWKVVVADNKYVTFNFNAHITFFNTYLIFFNITQSKYINLYIFHIAVIEDPEFTDVIENITVPAGRSVKLACSVKNLGSYKVSI